METEYIHTSSEWLPVWEYRQKTLTCWHQSLEAIKIVRFRGQIIVIYASSYVKPWMHNMDCGLVKTSQCSVYIASDFCVPRTLRSTYVKDSQHRGMTVMLLSLVKAPVEIEGCSTRPTERPDLWHYIYLQIYQRWPQGLHGTRPSHRCDFVTEQGQRYK